MWYRTAQCALHGGCRREVYGRGGPARCVPFVLRRLYMPLTSIRSSNKACPAHREPLTGGAIDKALPARCTAFQLFRFAYSSGHPSGTRSRASAASVQSYTFRSGGPPVLYSFLRICSILLKSPTLSASSLSLLIFLCSNNNTPTSMRSVPHQWRRYSNNRFRQPCRASVFVVGSKQSQPLEDQQRTPVHPRPWRHSPPPARGARVYSRGYVRVEAPFTRSARYCDGSCGPYSGTPASQLKAFPWSPHSYH